MSATAVLAVLTVAVAVLVMALVPPVQRSQGRGRVPQGGAR